MSEHDVKRLSDMLDGCRQSLDRVRSFCSDLLQISGAVTRLSIEDAQLLDVCRYCFKRSCARQGEPFILNFGAEFAHEKCIPKDGRFVAARDSKDPFLRRQIKDLLIKMIDDGDFDVITRSTAPADTKCEL